MITDATRKKIRRFALIYLGVAIEYFILAQIFFWIYHKYGWDITIIALAVGVITYGINLKAGVNFGSVAENGRK